MLKLECTPLSGSGAFKGTTVSVESAEVIAAQHYAPVRSTLEARPPEAPSPILSLSPPPFPPRPCLQHTRDTRSLPAHPPPRHRHTPLVRERAAWRCDRARTRMCDVTGGVGFRAQRWYSGPRG